MASLDDVLADIALVADEGDNTPATVRTALTSVFGGRLSWCALGQSSAQTIGTGAWTPVEFDTEIEDTDDYHNLPITGTHMRLYPPAAGLYVFGGGGRMALTGSARVAHRLTINDTPIPPQAETTGANAEFVGDTIYVVRSLAAAPNYVTLEVLHTRGADQDTLPEAYGFWIAQLAVT